MTAKPTALPSSYRDPSGFVFEKDGVVYRQVNLPYMDDFDHLMQSGLYERLVNKQLLIPHEEVNIEYSSDAEQFKILRPEQIAVVSYPYEWSFGMLKDAALLTLTIQRQAIDAGMTLKDATPYNIQWNKGRLIFIDTLSFERYNEEEPWIAYRQFCESFLSPLLLMHYTEQPLQQLLLAYPDGIPVAITSSLLPGRTRFSLHTYLHIHLQGRMQQHAKDKKKVIFSKRKMLNIISSLESLINRLKPPSTRSGWSNYYTEPHLTTAYLGSKREIIQNWLKDIEIKNATDVGANDGTFSRLIAEKNIPTLVTDFDMHSIDRLYSEIKKKGEISLQPLVVDLANPSPGIGFDNKERTPLLVRLRADLVMALAFLHHLVIGRNYSLSMIVSFFKQITGSYLVVEFVPKEDEMSRLMLSHRKDIFTSYDQQHFEQAFAEEFSIVKKEKIAGSIRTLYLMTPNEK